MSIMEHPVPITAKNSEECLHFQYLRRETESFIARNQLLPDKYPPQTYGSFGKPVGAWSFPFASYYFYENVFIKRIAHADERGFNKRGQPNVVQYHAARLRNEAATLQFLAAKTTIPIPKFLGLWEQNGLVYLKTEMITDGVELASMSQEEQQKAAPFVQAQLETDVLPQLRALRRNRIGSINTSLPVIPPPRLWQKEERKWPVVESREGDAFVFCHMDLGRQNIMVDPKTFHIVCILDWEFSGFFPHGWEIPFFNADGPREMVELSLRFKTNHAAFFDDYEPM